MTSATEAFSQFAIGFDERDRERLHALWDGVIDSGKWSHGPMNAAFEEAWGAWNGAESVALGSWSGGALAALHFAGVKGRNVLCPSNTFMATPLAIENAGGVPVFIDCRRDDLCASYDSFVEAAERTDPAAAVVVHVGGHIAFDIDRIAEYCREKGIFLLEDCAHAHGADWNGRRPGTFGDAGVYSFYATKTVSTGEGGVLVSGRDDVIAHARAFRDYGKPDYAVHGLNCRMSEFTAALALVQAERLPEIVEFKNRVAREVLDPQHPDRLQLPQGMTSGFYKYIVFSPVERSTGKVYDTPCHHIMETGDDLPNTDWVAENHWCVPLYYRPES